MNAEGCKLDEKLIREHVLENSLLLMRLSLKRACLHKVDKYHSSRSQVINESALISDLAYLPTIVSICLGSIPVPGLL